MSQADMAARLQVSPRSLQKYEAGEREIPFTLMQRLYDFIGTNPTWIVLGLGSSSFGDEPPTPNNEPYPSDVINIAIEKAGSLKALSKALSWPHSNILRCKRDGTISPYRAGQLAQYVGDDIVPAVISALLHGSWSDHERSFWASVKTALQRLPS